MAEYSDIGSRLVVLPPANRVLRVSPKRGPGDEKRRNRKELRKKGDGSLGEGVRAEAGGTAEEAKGEAKEKGSEVDIVI
ncbi:MAG: hypothetical protein DRH12_04425 [Deltaproteobacteria bacterium]|nr:MAG: hypothetical protein DRH12_04425 [Deltaproteobacteria bacterium]